MDGKTFKLSLVLCRPTHEKFLNQKMINSKECFLPITRLGDHSSNKVSFFQFVILDNKD
jgi:hypothetical protein